MAKKREKRDLNPQKLKLFFIANYFMKYTDDESDLDEPHALYVSEIKELLRKDGIDAEEHSISRDIQLLRDYFKMDIRGGKGKRYYLAKRIFNQDELDTIIECIASAKFISASDERRLIEELKRFFSDYQAEFISVNYYDIDRHRRTQEGTLETIRTIKKAITTNSILSFRYTTRRINDLNKPVPRRNGRKYTVSPFKIVLSEGNHYLVGYNHQAQGIRTFRIDRITDLQTNNFIPIEGREAFDALEIQNYARQTFGMFVERPQEVTILFDNSLLDTAWDRFGGTEGARYARVDDDHFSLTATIAVSPVFFGWLFGLGEKAVITSPPKVVDDFKAYLQKTAQLYN